LNVKIDKYEKKVEILLGELEQSKELVQTLTKKIFEKELKINELSKPI